MKIMGTVFSSRSNSCCRSMPLVDQCRFCLASSRQEAGSWERWVALLAETHPRRRTFELLTRLIEEGYPSPLGRLRRRPRCIRLSLGQPCCAMLRTGNEKWKVAPGPSLGVAHNRPPCDSTMERLIAKPKPIPVAFVVKKGWNSRSTC